MPSEASAAALAAASLHTLMGSAIPVGLAVLDRELRYVQINAMLAEANGLGVAEHLGRSVREVLPKAADALEPILQVVLDSGRGCSHLTIAAEVPSLPGELSDWEASCLPIAGPDGGTIGVLVQAQNRSLACRNRHLQQHDLQLRHVLDSLFVFVGLLDPAGVLLEVNRAPLEAAGIALEEVRGRPLWDTSWWSFDAAKQAWLRDAVQRVAAGEVLRSEVEVRMAGDSRMTIDFMLAPLRNAAGRVTHLVGSAVDVSARLASERALRDSDDRYRRMFEGSTLGKCLVDSDGRILLANESLAQMVGYPVQQMVGMSVHELVPPRQREAHAGMLRDFMREPRRRAVAERPNLLARRRDGSEFPVEIALNPMREGNDRQVLATISDVTARRAAQAEIERALREKTALLNEVHHRVKNNLQVISSLLSLQARHAGPEVQAALRDSQSRVHSMALMHQLLYERADFSALELGSYLRRLGALLRDTYLGSGSAVRLQITAPEQGLRIDLQRAIPCGLLVTELVTNAIKHAFAGGTGGRIDVRVAANAQGEACVEVLDDGVGMPAEIACRRGLGLQLLPVLAEQCRARLEQLAPELGTHFRLCLQLDQALQGEGYAGQS